jgi:Zn-dependent peptidase ImmA (M78 family)
MDEAILKPDYAKAKGAALELLKYCGIDSPPIDPVKIAEILGISVNFVSFKKNHNNISGFYLSKENAIYVNASEYIPRVTFTVAHEIGHQQLHKKWAESKEYKVLYRDQVFKDPKDPKELEANTFAAHLLVPKILLDQYRKIASISELATLFLVSEPVIRIRLKNEYKFGIR